MNSDPHDSTAWRSFGMLDADESAAFDDATRHDPQLKASLREMDRLQSAVALVASRPVMPRDGHLERVLARVGHQPKRGLSLWFGISGWAAAAALTLLLVWNANISPESPLETHSPTSSTAAATPIDHGTNQQDGSPRPTVDPNEDPSTPTTPPHTPSTAASSLVIRRETEQLTREIASLQDQLKSYELREQRWFQSIPGVATPVIMVMTPPGTPSNDTSLVQNDYSPVSQLLVDTLRVSSSEKQQPEDAGDAAPPVGGTTFSSDGSALPASSPESPTAIPIYDAARDAGTLVVSHLPPVPENVEYNLWVQTSPDEKPLRLGILPNAGTSSSESFDFNLGTNAVMPHGFVLTKDPSGKPKAPNKNNTVLQSPQAPPP